MKKKDAGSDARTEKWNLRTFYEEKAKELRQIAIILEVFTRDADWRRTEDRTVSVDFHQLSHAQRSGQEIELFTTGSEHVYRVYQQAGNRHYRSIDLYSPQAAARPTHNQSERALNLVMMHRLRTLEWWADVLQMDVRRLSKLGSEHLLLQWMRKPSAGSPALGVLQGNMRCRSPAREDDGSSEVMSSMYEANFCDTFFEIRPGMWPTNVQLPQVLFLVWMVVADEFDVAPFPAAWPAFIETDVEVAVDTPELASVSGDGRANVIEPLEVFRAQLEVFRLEPPPPIVGARVWLV
ncbi:hypothetical protein AK812_SmicGene11261 [Symbiodinium microadriaticum]|uniref:Uncharacterized protein n=1 Tax=Symbiodinium microadriaticum TaxID=2951 RepID=A0A1Q9EDR9_SYMMI|nr:hypothetical protein AK812_SmicGene11261 [Symbiodinium microadriaticum]